MCLLRVHCALHTRRWTWRRRFYCKKCHCIIDLIYLIPCVTVAVAISCNISYFLGSFAIIFTWWCVTVQFVVSFVFLMYAAYIMCQTHNALHANQLYYKQSSCWLAAGMQIARCTLNLVMVFVVLLHWSSLSHILSFSMTKSNWSNPLPAYSELLDSVMAVVVSFLSILWGQYDRLIRNAAYKIHMRTKCGKKLTHIAVRHALSYVCER